MTKEYCSDMHVHSRYSPSCLFKGYASRSTISDIFKTAKKKGLKGIAITDHNVIKGSLKAARIAKRHGIVAVPSMEIHSKQGHILAYNINEPVKRGLDFRETIEKIHALGGIAVCAHPLIKIFGIGRKRVKFFDGVEVFNGREGREFPKEGIGKNQFVTGGTDAHTFNEVGNVVTVFEEGFSNAEEMIELLRKRKSSFKLVKKTSKISNIILPQIMNIANYHADIVLNRVFRP